MLVVDFSAEGAPGVDLPTKQTIITYLAAVLFERFTHYKTQDDTRYLLFVIEEAQNFCPDQSYPSGASLAKTKLSAIARRTGRGQRAPDDCCGSMPRVRQNPTLGRGAPLWSRIAASRPPNDFHPSLRQAKHRILRYWCFKGYWRLFGLSLESSPT